MVRFRRYLNRAKFRLKKVFCAFFTRARHHSSRNGYYTLRDRRRQTRSTKKNQRCATLERATEPRVTRSKSIELHFMPSGIAEYSPLKRIYIRFGTYMTQNSGEVEFKFFSLDGPRHRQSFPLGTSSANAYRYFDLDGEVITERWIHSLSGYGISAWKSTKRTE